jgi:hypothetical protein
MTELAAAIRHIPRPFRIAKLPISDKGFPTPAFVAWLDSEGKNYLPAGTFGAKRDFRIIDHRYMDRCYRFHRCWICDEPLGRHRVFVIGPMCAVNRNTMEPPSHRSCAEYAVRTCPFMMQPRMRRNPAGDIQEHMSVPGIHLDRNPGCYCLYETEHYRRIHVRGGMLCRLGDPARVEWMTEGRPSTRAEVTAAIDSGMPFLMDIAAKEGPEAVKELAALRARVDAFLPA